MTDARLRDLERRFRETGAEADEAAWLVERVRIGVLPRERVELAAALGHGPARVAFGGQRVLQPLDLLKDDTIVPRDARAHAAVAAARAVLPEFEERHPGRLEVRRAIEAAERYLADPSEDARSAVERTSEAALPRDLDLGDPTCVPECCWSIETGAVAAAMDLARIVLDRVPLQYGLLSEAVEWTRQHGRSTQEVDLPALIRDAVVRWALTQTV